MRSYKNIALLSFFGIAVFVAFFLVIDSSQKTIKELSMEAPYYGTTTLTVPTTTSTTTSTTTTTSTATSTTIETPIPCTYSCSEWSSCSSSGTMTRSCSKKPDDCYVTSSPPYTSQPCTYVPTVQMPTCNFTYGEWGPCTSSGKQYRPVISKYPEGCIGGTYETTRPCDYVPTNLTTNTTTTATSTTSSVPTVNCTSNCGSWSSCFSDGHQERKCTAPSGCAMQSWVEKRSCTYNTSSTSTVTSATSTPTVIITPTALNCTPNCSSWSDCGQDGYQIRNCNATYGCPKTSWTEKNYCGSNYTVSVSATTDQASSTTTPASNTSTALSGNTSVANSCSYQCGAWSDCYPGNYQTRMCQKPYGTTCLASQEKRYCLYVSPEPSDNTITTESSVTAVSTSPASCSYQCSSWGICSPAGTKYRNCWPYPSGCTGETKTETQSCAPIYCKFTYSEWSTCAEGMQFRKILTTGPAGCVGGNLVLEQNCEMAEVQESEEAKVSESIPVTTAETASVSAPVDPEIVVNDDWKKETFKTTACHEKICGGSVDPDNDGLSNNDEYRYGTNPLDRDTDNDGKTDGEEVAAGTDPVKSSAKGEADAVTFENPKETGVPKPEIYQVTDVEMVAVSEGGQKQMKLSGKGPALSYINVYIYSGDPIIVTVKTDSNGDWTYTMDKELENGNHEVYVAVTNNSGAIKAKSEPLPFVKRAQAVEVAKAAEANVVMPETKKGISIRNILFVLALAFFAIVAGFIFLGAIIKKVVTKIKLN